MTLSGTTKLGSVRPDDPWCWLISAGNCIIAISVAGIFRSFGVFYQPIMTEFEAKFSDISLMTGLFAGAMAFGAMVPGLARGLGLRKIALVTGFFYCVSLFATSISPHMYLVHLFCGVFAGFFSGAQLYTMYLTCNLYFVRHRSKGTNIALFGVPLGSIFLPPLIEWLNNSYGWRGSLMILSAAALNSCAAAMLYIPVDIEETRLEVKNLKSNSVESLGKDEGNVDRNNNSLAWRLKHWAFAKDLCVFRNPMLVNMLLSGSVYYPGMVGGIYLLVPFGTEYLHASSFEASFLLTLFGVGDCLGKIIFGIAGDSKRVDKALLLSILSFLGAINFFLISFCTSYQPVAALSCLQGFVCSAYHGLKSVVYTEIVGLERLPGALAYHGFMNNIVTLPVLYIIGYCIDATGDMRVAWYITVGLLLCTSLFLLVVYLLKRKQRSLEKKLVVTY